MQASDKNKFFVTRQAANIMEDLAKRLKKTASVSVLHGATGVGKSRLLNQFLKTRIQTGTAVLVCFKPANHFVVNGDVFENKLIIEKVLSRVEQYHNIIVDQFELAPADIQLLFLKFLKHDETARKLNLVISVTSSSIAGLNRLSKQTGLLMESVELKPLTYQEQVDYLSASCCKMAGQIILPSAELKKMLKMTAGNFAALLSVQHQFRKTFVCMNQPAGNGFKLDYKIVVIILLAVVATLFFEINPDFRHEMFAHTAGMDPNKKDINSKFPVKGDKVDEISEEVVIETVQTLTANNPIEAGFVTETMQDQQKSIVKVVDKDSLRADLIVNRAKDEINNKILHASQAIFTQRLAASLAWLKTASLDTTSIQIMTINVNDQKRQSLNLYLEELKKQSIDLEAIKIYPLKKMNKEMYGVLYGEYDDVISANQAIRHLPDILKANQPFVRTVRGVREEMQDL